MVDDFQHCKRCYQTNFAHCSLCTNLFLGVFFHVLTEIKVTSRFPLQNVLHKG